MGLMLDDLARLLTAKRGGRGVRVAAQEAGVSSATFSRVENGHMPDLETFRKLCIWVQRDPKEFLGIEPASHQKEHPPAVAHFKKDKTVKMETAKALGEMILAAQKAILAREKLAGR
jgi:transcriptional regulator with XRE-family HTH domain